MIIAALWIVFLIGFVAGSAWANAVGKPAPPIAPDDDPGPTIGKHSISYPLPKIPQYHSRRMLPESPNGTALKAIAHRHNTDIGARN